MLKELREGIGVKEFAESANISRAKASRTLRKLKELGVIFLQEKKVRFIQD